VVLAVMAVMASPGYAETLEDEAVKRLEAKPADGLLLGLVINRTVTVLGRDFYQYFSTAWRYYEGGGDFSVTVYERPTAIRGSQIWVQYGQRRVFQAYLSPARSAVKEVARQAAEIAYENVVEIAVQRALFTSVDLAPEEL